MRALTEETLRASFVNAEPDDLRLLTLPIEFLLADWDHLDFYAWRDTRSGGRGYLIAEREGKPVGIVLRFANGNSSARAGMCNICHTMQPADQVKLASARRAPHVGGYGDSVGTYICADLSCHENVRLAAPLAPSEIRSSVDLRIDGTKRRAEAFVDRIRGDEGDRT